MINKEALNIIKNGEGLSLSPYLDSVGIPTIGYGNTYYLDGKKVSLCDKPLTIEQAENLLMLSLKEYEEGVKELVKVPINENQFGALVSFAYNVGLGNLAKSTLLKKLNSSDYLGASEEFLRWNKAGGKVLNGLIKRRKQEKELFLK